MAFNILALSGGGFLGLFSAQLLAHLEKQAGVPIARCFDLICGTSIGGIVALGLSLEIPAADIVKAFEENGQRIFPPRSRPFGVLSDMWQFGIRPKHDPKGLRDTVTAIVGPGRLLGEARHRLLIPAVNMTKGKIQMFKTPHHPNFQRDHLLSMIDVALATSAAPLFFPLAEVNNSLFTDGGLYANAPDICGIHEATHFLKVPRDDVHILSIGTTTASFSLPHKHGVNFGAVQWLTKQRLISTVMSAQQQLTHFLVQHQLGERYIRLDRDLSAEQNAELVLDNASETARKTILGLADALYQERCVDQNLRMLLAHRAPTPTFFYGPNANEALVKLSDSTS
jgi:patatin-like phospholipase/acyl hydrolase